MLLKDFIKRKNNKNILKNFKEYKESLDGYKKGEFYKYDNSLYFNSLYFSYLFSIYYNTYPNKRTEFYVKNFDNNFLKRVDFQYKKEKNNKSSILRTLILRNSNDSILNFILNHLIEIKNTFINTIDSEMPNIHIPQYLLFENILHYNDIFYFFDYYKKYNITGIDNMFSKDSGGIITSYDFFDFMNEFSKSILFYNPSHIFLECIKDIKNPNILDLHTITTNMLNLMEKLNHINCSTKNNDVNGVILIKKVGPPSFINSNGCIEKFNKNKIKNYLNYNVETEITSKTGNYTYMNLIFNLSD